MTDLDALMLMLARAGITFTRDNDHGWEHRIAIEGDRCFVFSKTGELAGIRNYNDTESFDS